MEPNIGSTDKKIRGTIAILLIIASFWTGMWWMLFIAAALIITVFSNYCPFYALCKCKGCCGVKDGADEEKKMTTAPRLAAKPAAKKAAKKKSPAKKRK
jgi:hypothetical protein